MHGPSPGSHSRGSWAHEPVWTAGPVFPECAMVFFTLLFMVLRGFLRFPGVAPLLMQSEPQSQHPELLPDWAHVGLFQMVIKY